MSIALKESEEPNTALLEPPAERNRQIEAEDEEAEEDNGAYFPERPFVYELDRQGYFTSDGQGMAEKEEHRSEITKGIGILQNYFSDRSDVYVGGCDFVHYRRGVRTKYISPDLYVFFGVEGRDAQTRNSQNFKVWENGGQLPAIIFEYTSQKTKAVDEGSKFTLYEQVFKTPEYILFDPRLDVLRLKTRLRGYRLNALGVYEPIQMEPTPLSRERLYSEQLDLYLETDGTKLRFFDPKIGAYLRTFNEEARDRRREQQRANEEARRADEETQRANEETRRANEETRRANEETRRANEEALARRQAQILAAEETRRADEAEARTAALLAELEALRRERNS